MPESRIALIAAGGTGGHIWPGVAVARVLESRGWMCKFVSGDRPVETEVYRAANVEPIVFRVPLPSGGRWRTYLSMGPMLLKSLRLIKEHRPDAVLATGGYISAPVALAGAMKRIPTVLVEPNSVPGRVTRRLARRVSAVALADPKAAEKLNARRVEITGNPQNWSVADLKREAARERFGLREGTVCVLIAGGSQGAKKVNALVLGMLQKWSEDDPGLDLDVIWVAGSRNAEEIQAALPANDRIQVQVHGHIVPFQDALAVADVALSRAGAGSVSDLALAGVPSVLFPLPIAMDDHQRANASRLVDAGGAVTFDERTQDAEQLSWILRNLLEDPTRLESMREATRTVAQPNAAEAVADLMESLLRSN